MLSHPSLSPNAIIMSWHSVQHTLSTAYTQDNLSSLHSHNFGLTPECSFSFRRSSLPIDRHQPVLHTRFKAKVTLSDYQGGELTNWWIGSWRAVHRLPPSTRPILLDHGLQVYLQTRLFTSCMFAQSWPPSAYLETRSIMASKHISKYARLPPPTASPQWLDHGLRVHIWEYLIVISSRTSNWSQTPPAASPVIACVDG